MGFPGGAVVENPPANAGDMGLSRVPHATKQVSLWATTTEPTCHNYWACTPRARALQQEKPTQLEAQAPQGRAAPALRN